MLNYRKVVKAEIGNEGVSLITEKGSRPKSVMRKLVLRYRKSAIMIGGRAAGYRLKSVMGKMIGWGG